MTFRKKFLIFLLGCAGCSFIGNTIGMIANTPWIIGVLNPALGGIWGAVFLQLDD